MGLLTLCNSARLGIYLSDFQSPTEAHLLGGFKAPLMLPSGRELEFTSKHGIQWRYE